MDIKRWNDYADPAKIWNNRFCVVLCLVVLAISIFWPIGNHRDNMLLRTMSANSVESVTVHQPIEDSTALLGQDSVRELVKVMNKVVLRGDDRLVYEAECYNPFFTVNLSDGYSFTFACYNGHYIMNGRCYAVDEADTAVFSQLRVLYTGYLRDPAYFVRGDEND